MDHLQDTDGSIFKVSRTIDNDLYMEEIVNVQQGTPVTVYSEANNSFAKFHSFPAQHGWKIGHDYRLRFDSEAVKVGKSQLADRLAKMLQTWLFFGLIYTVVCNKNDKPLLHFRDFWARDAKVTTSRLEGNLEKWYEAVMDRKRENHDQARLYMVRVESVLHLAKMVVQKNVGFNNGKVLYSTSYSDRASYVTDELALSLMVLGETLSTWKARIMKSTKTFIRGWHDEEEDEGWGPPRAVFREMNKEGWCNRAVHLLQSQLRSSATLLLVAYNSYRNSDTLKQDPGRHRDVCTEQVCKVIEAAQLHQYETGHILADHVRSQCEQVEADMSEILRILATEDTNAIPLLKIKTDKDRKKFSLTVHNLSEMGWKAQYGAISHVWADGWGNEAGNWLWSCQIGVIFRMLEKGAKKRNIHNPDSDTLSIPFWMDTLIIPVMARTTECNGRLEAMGLFKGENSARALRTKAIEQIGTVYPRSNFTVVLDNGLSSLEFNSSPRCHSGMSILASNWMKRLWTLQEAVLSRKLFITAKPNDRDDSGIIDLDDVLNELAEASNGGGTRSFTGLTKKHLTDSIMHSARKKPDDASGEFRVQDPFTMVVDAWRAARWRNTSNEAHEALALATLMNLPYAAENDSKIKNAGLPVDPSDLNSKPEARRDQLVREFWTLFDREYEGHIPSGIIFLPGPKVELRGFGWAPRTFMEAYKLDYPDPFTRGLQPTKLSPEFGLKVHYPGIILHCTSDDATRRSILGTDRISTDEQAFRFPVDQYQWYAIQPADRTTPANLSGILSRRTRLAILMTRPYPREQPKEIALLVEIYKEVGEGGDSVTYYCQMVQRMKIWLDVLPINPGDVHGNTTAKRLSVNSHLTGPQRESIAATDTPAPGLWALRCLGEVLDPSQAWYVDSIVDGREKSLPPFRKSAAGQAAPDRESVYLAAGPRRRSRQPLPQLRQQQSHREEEHNESPDQPPSLPQSAPSRYQATSEESEPPIPRIIRRMSTLGSGSVRSMRRGLRRVGPALVRPIKMVGGRHEMQPDSTTKTLQRED